LEAVERERNEVEVEVKLKLYGKAPPRAETKNFPFTFIAKEQYVFDPKSPS
jgi:hypothetical protein